jgi:hypothetical protein
MTYSDYHRTEPILGQLPDVGMPMRGLRTSIFVTSVGRRSPVRVPQAVDRAFDDKKAAGFVGDHTRLSRQSSVSVASLPDSTRQESEAASRSCKYTLR